MVLAGIGGLGAPELALILVIVVLLFGIGRLGGLGRELGQSIREFRKATKDPEEEQRKRLEEEHRQADAAARYTATGAAPSPSVNGQVSSGTVVTPPAQNNPARPPDFTGR